MQYLKEKLLIVKCNMLLPLIKFSSLILFASFNFSISLYSWRDKALQQLYSRAESDP